jgi:exopolysaccharide biosynthesis polyprenyl glycosylphosphotransferase
MSFSGTFVRRHFEPLVLSVQVLIDLAVVLLACRLGYETREYFVWRDPTDFDVYREIFLLTAAVTLVCFHAFGMYSPLKSLLNIEEFKGVAKSTFMSFLIVHMLLILLRGANVPDKGVQGVLLPLHKLFDLDARHIYDYSRLTLVAVFGYVFALTIASRFISFRVIQNLHQRGIGNRNVLIFGTGETARRLQKKFVQVPTLGLNLLGFVSDEPGRAGEKLERSVIIGGAEELEWLVRRHKISEVFVAMPEATEEHIMGVVETLEQLGVVYHVVPRFVHLLSHKVRIESLDSIPLITRPDRVQTWYGSALKRAFDLVFAVLALGVGAPLFLIPMILIRRESPGPAFFLQTRIGRDGRPFRMIKFRTMHLEASGDAPAPSQRDDPRITHIGRWLRRYSLDELPQVINVLKGEMSMVGPRPEMPFIVDKYGPMERERLRVKPGLTGLWQISYARGEAIHDNIDYDIYYVENQSLLLDFLILHLTVFAVVKGTGAY